jgi:hypothetical protein
MTIKLHRCPNEWAKISGHPCWKVQKALDDQGIEYQVVKGPLRRGISAGKLLEGKPEASQPE